MKSKNNCVVRSEKAPGSLLSAGLAFSTGLILALSNPVAWANANTALQQASATRGGQASGLVIATAISTSRSNIKYPSKVKGDKHSSGPASAAINTTRSNIRHPSKVKVDKHSGGPASAAINTSRSNIKRP